MVAEPSRSQLNPQALPLADAARVFSAAAGATIDVAMLEADVETGAPANADGTLNLVHYAAWLLREMARGR
jgi:hypothetical protein